MPLRDTVQLVTPRNLWLSLLVFFAFFGFYHSSPALVALFEAMLVLTVLAWAYVRVAAKRLAASRSFAPRAYEEEEVRVALKIWNRLPLPLFLTEVRDWFPCDGLPEKRLVVQRLPASGAVQVDYAGACVHGRGRFQIGPLEVTVSDPLGLFRMSRVFAELGELVVYPRTFPIRDLGLQELQWRAPVSISAGRVGHAATFYGTREYRPGDNIRRIHWPSTLRAGRLVLKEFEQDTNLEVTCFLDLDQKTLRGVGRGSNIEQAVRIAASVADHVTSRLCSFQLVADPGAPLLLPARPGKMQLMATLDALARVRATGRTPYLELVSSAMRFVGEGSAVVLILNTLDVDPDGLFAVLSEILRRNARVVPITLDDATFIPLETSGRERAASPVLLQRLSSQLGAFGVSPVVIRSGDDLPALFANPITPSGVRIPEPATVEEEIAWVESA
jgi:uncharacterized protein (DUF58 family)